MKKTKIFAMAMAAMMSVGAMGVNALAESDDYDVIYENTNLLTTDSEILANALEDESLMSVNESNKLYYEDGKFYEFKCDVPKVLTQKINTIKRSGDVVENYITDAIISGRLVTYEVDDGYQDKLKNGNYYSRAYVNQVSDTETSDSGAMTIKQTTNYSTIDGCIAIGTVYGKVLSCDISSGIYPQSMTMEAHILHGGVYNSSGQKIGSQGQIDNYSPTFTNISVGDNYYKQYDICDISKYYYVDGDIYDVYTVVTVNASRGVSVYLPIDLKWCI